MSRWLKGNFLTIPNKHLLFSLSEAELKVYLAICDHADDSGQCHPSYGRISKLVGYSRRHVINMAGRLVEMGLLEVEHRTKPDGNNATNIFQVLEVAPPSEQYSSPPLVNSDFTTPSEQATSPKLTHIEPDQLEQKDSTKVLSVKPDNEKVDKRDPEINQLVEHFEQVMGEKLPKPQRQRWAAKTLISRLNATSEGRGLEAALWAVDFAARIRREQYAPQIYTIEDLRDKLPKLKAYYERMRGKVDDDLKIKADVEKATGVRL
jgi:hypothetical protein